MKTKKIIIGLLLIVLAGSTTLFIQSCNSNDDESAVHETPVTIIAESDELIDFATTSHLLEDKFFAYTQTLTQAEFEQLMYNLNNDEYMSEVVNKAKIKDEIRLVINQKEKLLRNTNYLKLNKSEQTKLFSDISAKTKRVTLKTRTENGGTNGCDQRRLEDYAWARGVADLGLIGCTCALEIPIVACICYATVLANYANNLRQADNSYDDCMKNAKR